jgi:hypothetical protein
MEYRVHVTGKRDSELQDEEQSYLNGVPPERVKKQQRVLRFAQDDKSLV